MPSAIILLGYYRAVASTRQARSRERQTEAAIPRSGERFTVRIAREMERAGVPQSQLQRLLMRATGQEPQDAEGVSLEPAGATTSSAPRGSGPQPTERRSATSSDHPTADPNSVIGPSVTSGPEGSPGFEGPPPITEQAPETGDSPDGPDTTSDPTFDLA